MGENGDEIRSGFFLDVNSNPVPTAGFGKAPMMSNFFGRMSFEVAFGKAVQKRMHLGRSIRTRRKQICSVYARGVECAGELISAEHVTPPQLLCPPGRHSGR